MRALNPSQKALLRSDVRAKLLLTMYLDSGTYRFCDDVFDSTDGTHTYIGASNMLESVEVKSGQDLAAEPITLVIDGNRMTELGVADPAKVFAEMMDEMHHQRKTVFSLGLHELNSANMQIVIPLHAGKINHCRLVDEAASAFGETSAEAGTMSTKLNIVIDALASRYNRSTFRTRSHNDQLEIDPTDKFYSFVASVPDNELQLYWGKAAPKGSSVAPSGSGGFLSGVFGGLLARNL